MVINPLSGKSLSPAVTNSESVSAEQAVQTTPTSTPAPAESSQERKPAKEELVKAVESMNRFLQSSQTHLKFVLHEELNEYYVTVVNDETQEVIREIPSKKVLDIAAKMQEMIGLLVDERR